MKRHIIASLRDVWDGIRVQPGRIGLSFMAIGVGITALTVLVAVLGGLQQRSRQMLQEFGANVFAVVQERTDEKKALSAHHARMLAANLTNAVVTGVRKQRVPTYGTAREVDVVMTDAQFIKVRQWPVLSGRFLDERDVQTHQRSLVVSRALSRAWNWNPGDTVSLKDMPFTVVGVVDPGGGLLEVEAADSSASLGDQIVFVPAGMPTYWSEWIDQTPDALNALFIRVRDPRMFDAVLRRAQRLMTQSGYQVNGLEWITPDILLKRIRRLQQTIRLTVGSIAVLCLVLGGTTLMSLMVANVRDRVSEIGLRRALGATPWDVASLFLLEACLVTGAAGFAGSILTHGVLLLLRGRFPVPLQLGMVSIFLPLIVAVALGAIFSYAPAHAAARIAPSAALRND
ncbi:MAG: ABC transporter permease [Spartobacteria bacterium]|nr:ABC transporter permease [Spartobacteria bacterium]